MKLFKYTCGDTELFGVAEDEKDAYDRKVDVDPTFHYIPVTVEEVKVNGYEINVTPVSDIPSMNRDQLKRYLKDRNIEFTPQWGEDKLREVALQHA
jgi:hypothetical protein